MKEELLAGSKIDAEAIEAFMGVGRRNSEMSSHSLNLAVTDEQILHIREILKQRAGLAQVERSLSFGAIFFCSLISFLVLLILPVLLLQVLP